VGARDDPARRSRADGPVLGQRHLDRCHALFTPTLAKHRHQRPCSPVIERFDQLGDPLVDLAAETATLQFTLCAVIFGPSSANRSSLLDKPVGISLWSQCNAAGWPKGVRDRAVYQR
jgi:hypothetical protein